MRKVCVAGILSFNDDLSKQNKEDASTKILLHHSYDEYTSI